MIGVWVLLWEYMGHLTAQEGQEGFLEEEGDT